MVGMFPPGLGAAGQAIAQSAPLPRPLPMPAPSAGPMGGSGADTGIDIGSGAPARDRSRERERPCKCPPEKGEKVRRKHSMNPEPRRYQARITGYEYGITTDGKGRETRDGWNMEWAWLGTDFDGFQPSQCLLQEAKGNYDQFLNEQDMPRFPFQGFKDMLDTIQKQGRLVQANPPAKLIWYFETPGTRALMMAALRSANVPSVYRP
ncbi:restriction endonuclease fold toxin 5 of polymorphic toxin system [Paraburkholderia caballeronis]|nr:restriction endonuclease fold toxin 5 of polymorphic toxin system [Paraburkholderia caballeronis]